MKRRGRAARWRDGAGWCAAGGVAALGASIPLAGAGYVLDLAANLAPQGLMVGAVVGAWMAATRRWARLGVVCGACAVMAWPLLVHRAARVAPPAAMAPVRILVFNSSTSAGDAGAAMALIARCDADVVVLTEPSGSLLDRVRASPEIAARYPGYFLPERAAGGYILVLSAWAQRPLLGDAPRDIAQGGLRAVRIERPEGAFVLVALHPDSPRTPSEWAKGNEVVERTAALLTGDVLLRGLPVVVAADLNSTPSGWRSRRLSAAGVRRAKPIVAAGTYPAGWPWPMRVAIDDVWVSPPCGVVSWRALQGGGSDHQPVLVELAIPATPAGP